ncbi:MAG TPA: Hsp20/alpha crystallin family protein [Rhizomicrobium sp.]|jgi:HSP20 family protein|nr:Hsp20/alpha crystallin family protein [Rhizomicrobium sp.]
MATFLRPSTRSTLPSLLDEDGSLFGMWRDMDRLLDDFTRGMRAPAAARESGIINPIVDVSENDKGFEVKAELPGVDEKNIDVEYSDGILSLKAERSFEKEEKDEKKRYHLMERSYGTFMRRFRLPFDADPGKVEASFENGILRIFVPRPAGAKAHMKKIELKPTHH